MLLTPYFRNGGMIGKTLDFNSEDYYLIPVEDGERGTVEYVNLASTSTNGTTGDLTIDITSLAQVGDFVLVVAGANVSSSGVQAFNIAGYTEIANHSFVGAGQDVQMTCGYKFYTGASDNTITITGNSGGATQGAGAIAHIFRGVDQTNPLDVPVELSTTPQTVRPTPPPITPTTVGSMTYIAGAAGHAAGSFFFSAAGVNNIRGVTGNGTFDFTMLAARYSSWTSGTQTPSTFFGGTEDVSYNSIGLTVALRPAFIATTGTVLTYLNNYVDESNPGNPVTFSNVDFGTEATDRYIIVGYSTRNDSRTINSVTIGGVTATILTQLGDGNTTTGMAIAAVPTGTSGDVVVTLDGTADAHYLGVWSATGLASATPVDTATSAGNGSDAGSQSFTMNTDANGFVIVVDGSAAGGNGPENAATVSSNLTLRYDGVTTTPLHTTGSSAGADGLTDGTSTTFEITIGDTNNNNPAVAATFAGTTGGGGGTTEGNLKNSGIWDVTGVLDSFITGTGGGGGNYEVGFSPSLLTISGTNDAWTQQTVDISAYAGATVRLVFRYQNGAGFAGDIQLDQIDLDGNVYSFENVTHSFETSSVDDSATYAGVSWSNLTVTENLDGYWQVDQNGTPSNGTGRTDAADGNYYVYAETSSPANVFGYNFWLRSPEITLSGAPTLTFFEARNGGDIGTLDVHLDVIS